MHRAQPRLLQRVALTRVRPLIWQLDLKVGAQCLLTKNMPELKLVNGSRGVVAGFEEVYCNTYGVPAGNYTCPVIKFDSGQRLTVQPTSFFQAGQGGAMVRRSAKMDSNDSRRRQCARARARRAH